MSRLTLFLAAVVFSVSSASADGKIELWTGSTPSPIQQMRIDAAIDMLPGPVKDTINDLQSQGVDIVVPGKGSAPGVGGPNAGAHDNDTIGVETRGREIGEIAGTLAHEAQHVENARNFGTKSDPTTDDDYVGEPNATCNHAAMHANDAWQLCYDSSVTKPAKAMKAGMARAYRRACALKGGDPSSLSIPDCTSAQNCNDCD